MSMIKTITGLLLAAALTACGGGGGSAGTSGASTTSTTTGSSAATTSTTSTSPQDTLLALQLQNASGVALQAIAASTQTLLVATLKTTAGVPVVGQTVSFKESSLTSLSFFPGASAATTDANGVAKVVVQRVNLTTFGSSTFTATFSGSCLLLCGSTDFNQSSSNALTFRADPPAFQLDLRDASNAVTTSIGSNLTTSVNAVLKFEDGTPVVSKAVFVSDASGKVNFPNGSSALTSTAGVASLVVTRSSLSVSGAGTLNVSATITGSTSSGSANNTVVASTVDYQLGTANIALTGLNVGSGSLAAYGNRTVSVSVTASGVPATIPVQVTFGANCGVVSPTIVSTDAAGSASTTYTANDAACAGTNVSITAAATGATALSGQIVVAAPVATNVQFVSATPQLIYLKDTVGTTQAQVVFKVVDSSGNPVQNRTLKLSLSNIATGVSLDTLGNTSPVSYVSDSTGKVSAAVFSGTVPTSLTVRATLLDSAGNATTVFSDSNVLTVASGRPTQRSLSLAVEKFSIEGANIDNKSTNLTLTMSDRLGNPVPPGTQVNFVSETGVLIPAVCFVPPPLPATANSAAVPSSSCSVTLYSSGTRTANGLVAVMAYVAGEEDFVDVNGNNIYVAGDTFTDLGRASLDNVGTGVGVGVYNSGEFQVPRIGDAACTAAAGCVGDGVWGAADVRTQATVVFASSTATVVAMSSLTAASTLINSTDLVLNGLAIQIADSNGNSMPTGSQISVSAIDNGLPAQGYAIATCAVTSGATKIIPNTIAPTQVGITLSFCTRGDAVKVDVTTPAGMTTSQIFTIL